MSNLQIVLKQIFEEVKDGDCLGFLCAGIKHLPVEIATEGDCSHCATIWNVNQPNANTTTFNISEQSFSGGAFDQVSIIVQDGVYYAVNYTRLNNSERIYFKSLKQSVTDAQRKIGLDDALSQIGKKYGWLSCGLSEFRCAVRLGLSVHYSDERKAGLFHSESVRCAVLHRLARG